MLAPTITIAAQAASLMPADLVAAAASVKDYPTFCGIPPSPTGTRSAQGYHSLVVDTRLAGARVVALTAPSTFSLADSEDFAASARAWAAPPAPISFPDASDTAAFAKTARERALPPRRR